MQRREAEFAVKFSKWFKHKWPEDKPAYFEFKCCRSMALPFSAVSMKQLVNLEISKFYYKFSDFDRMGTPFDAVGFCGKGYIVIQYWKPRNKEFIIIPIDIFLEEKQSSSRKSLTEKRARELGQVCLLA